MTRSTLALACIFGAACSSPIAPETPSLATAATAPQVVVPDPVAAAPPPTAPQPEACHDRDSSWWWEAPSSVRFYNNCRAKLLNFVLVHFKVNTATLSTDQTRLDMHEVKLSREDGLGRLRAENVTACSQLDLYVGISIEDITSGRTKIHPSQEGQPGYVSPLDALVGPLGTGCAPLPPPNSCPQGVIAEDEPLTVVGNIARFLFFIAPGYADVRLSIVAFVSPHASVLTLPQTYSGHASGTFSAGGPYQLDVPLPDAPWWQVDVLCGPFTAQDLTEGNFAELDARTYWWLWHGGSGGK